MPSFAQSVAVFSFATFSAQCEELRLKTVNIENAISHLVSGWLTFLLTNMIQQLLLLIHVANEHDSATFTCDTCC